MIDEIERLHSQLAMSEMAMLRQQSSGKHAGCYISLDHRLPTSLNGKTSMTMFVRYIEEAKLTIFRTKHEADRFGALELAPEHILLALLSDPALIHGNMKGISEKDMRETIDAHLPRREPNTLPHDLPLSETARRALVLAEGEADTLGHTKIRNQHLLLGLLKLGDGYTAELLAKNGLSAEELWRQLESSSS